MATNYIALSVPVFFVLIGLELAWSSWKGLKLYRFSDAITNISCGIGQQLTGIFFKTALFFLYYWLFEHTRLFIIPQTGIWWIILFISVDFCYYWFHRLSHEINAIWATHIVHHQSEEYNLTVALRQSWFQGFFSSLFYLPLAILGFDPLMTITVIAFNTLYQFWIHTELIRNMGWFEYVFNTPSHHRVHHGSNPKYIDKNHAGTLIIWDRLFGTFQREEEAPVYGVTTPLRSWDPLQANLKYWFDLFRMSKHFHLWKDKFLLFFEPPGWKPQAYGGPDYPTAVSRTSFHKFDYPASAQMKWYVLIQFSVVLGVASLLLFKSAQLPLSETAPAILLCLASIIIFGWLLELRSYARKAELLRLPACALFLIFKFSVFPLWGSLLVVCWIGASLWTLVRSPLLEIKT